MEEARETVYGFSAPLLDGPATPVSLDQFRGQVLLIVNTASKCGFTPQYAGLEELYRTYKERGFAVLGFPCNQFGAQEPGSEAEIGAFCEKNYGVSFPLFAKIEVNGPHAHPLYRFLKKARTWHLRHGAHQMELHQVPGRPARQRRSPLRPRHQTQSPDQPPSRSLLDWRIGSTRFYLP